MKKIFKYFGILLGGICMSACGDDATDVALLKSFYNAQAMPLIDAVVANKPDKIAQALEQRIDVNVLGEHKVTPLLIAFLLKKRKSYQTLLEAGANPNIFSENSKPYDFYKQAAVMFDAAGLDDSYYLELALAHGGDPDLHNPYKPGGNIVPIFRAVMSSHPKNVQILIDHGANLEIDLNGTTVIFNTVTTSQFNILWQLVDGGANYLHQDKDGETIVDYIESGRMGPGGSQWPDYFRFVKKLRAEGIDVIPYAWQPEHYEKYKDKLPPLPPLVITK